MDALYRDSLRAPDARTTRRDWMSSVQSTVRGRRIPSAPIVSRMARATTVLAVLLAQRPAVAQGTPTTFTPGAREIYSLNFSSLGTNGLPKGIELLRGKPAMATKDGSPTLKASEPTELLVRLPEVLPDGFTLEFELIPKACCNPEDLAFEGTAAISRSPTSMHV